MIGRPLRLPALLLLALLAACTKERPAPPPPPERPQVHLRADAALEVMLASFWDGRQDYLERELPFFGIPTPYWHFAHAFEAMLDGVERSHGLRYAGWPERLFDSQAERSWNSNLYDDENWMALALLRAFDLGGGTRTLEQARLLGDHIFGAWDTTCCGPTPGGIWWDKAQTQKATASNAGPVITAVRLYERTAEAAYLEIARKVYAYWWAQMVVPETGQVLDNIKPPGTKYPWKYSYNEGQMVGAALELHRATGEASYLADAHLVGRRLASAFTVATEVGPVLSDGATCEADCALFKGIAFRYLHLLHRFDPRPEYEEVLGATAESIWTRARAEATGLFGTDWAGSQPTSSTLAQHSAATMALNLTASLAPGEVRESPAWSYEAEEAWLRGFGVRLGEPGGTSGFGFVSGQDQDDEAIRFRVEVPRAGRYTLVLRYRSPRSAQRTLASSAHSEAVVFSQTGDAFEELRLGWTLEPGPTALTLQRGEGARGRLELDVLEVEEPGGCDDGEAPAGPQWTNLGTGDVLCAPRLVCWSSSPDAEEYELIIDGASVCRTKASCCPLPTLAPGWHQAYVIGRGECGGKASRPVAFGWAPPLPEPLADRTGEGLRWAPVEGADGYDVFAGEARVCAGVRRPDCRFAPGSVPEGQLRVVARPLAPGLCRRP